MRVLHVAYNSDPDVTGGAVRTRYLVQTQARLGLNPIVLSSPFQPPADPAQKNGMERINGIPHYRCYNGHDSARFMAARKPLWERAAKLAALAPFVERVRHVAVRERVDIIHAHNLFFCGLAAAAAGRSLGLPVVYEVRSLIEEGIDSAGRIVPWAYRCLDRAACKLASHVTVLCRGLAEEMIRRGVPPTKITIAGNGVDLEAHRPPAVRQQRDFFVVGYIGTVVPYEGLEVLIDAAALLIGGGRALQVLVVGDGNARSGLEEQVRSRGLKRFVEFAGRVPHEQVRPYYDRIDLFVLPRRPGRISDLVTPLKPLEIMAHAKPLLASDCGGHRELIVDGVNGLLFAPHDPAVLAQRIEQAMADRRALVRLGTEARGWVSRHRTWESQCRPVIDVYERLLARKSQVLLVAPVPGPNPTGGVENGVGMILRSELARRHRIRVWRRAPGHTPFQQQLVQFARFAVYVATRRPRVVHVKSSSGANFAQSAIFAAIGRALLCRVLLQLHSGDFEGWYRQQSVLGRWAVRRALQIPCEILALSPYWRAFLSMLVPGRTIHVLPNGVELAKIPVSRRRPDSAMRVLTIATLGTHKGHLEIIDAAARVRERPIQFILAGPDQTSGRGEGHCIRRHAAQLGLGQKVEFPGRVGAIKKWELLSSADVFLLPSRAEGMPNAVLEAMAAGLPVIATPVGALPEMLPEGPLVPIGDSDAIVQVLLHLLDNPELRQEIGRRNRARVEAQYSFDSVVRQLDLIYSNQCGSAI